MHNDAARSGWMPTDRFVNVIDQRQLPHEFVTLSLKTVDDVIHAIREMVVRGAPLIGVTAAYGMWLAAANTMGQAPEPDHFRQEALRLKASRPTAVNLAWAVDRVLARIKTASTAQATVDLARQEADAVTHDEIENCRRIGEFGRPLIEEASRAKGGRTVHVLTHCNAGWLACVEYGTATAPIYAAFDRGIDLHVWVDETRPLNQGARLTAWELGEVGVPHTVITDNAGGHLMQHGMVDLVIVGSDRTTATGDVANKIGTYLKALAAKDNGVPFYVALPIEHLRLEPARRGCRHPHRGARPRRGALGAGLGRRTPGPRPDLPGEKPGRQLRLRRDPGAPGHRPHHGTGRLPGDRGGHPEIVSGQDKNSLLSLWVY